MAIDEPKCVKMPDPNFTVRLKFGPFEEAMMHTYSEGGEAQAAADCVRHVFDWMGNHRPYVHVLSVTKYTRTTEEP